MKEQKIKEQILHHPLNEKFFPKQRIFQRQIHGLSEVWLDQKKKIEFLNFALVYRI